jgi:hypothetical protein
MAMKERLSESKVGEEIRNPSKLAQRTVLLICILEVFSRILVGISTILTEDLRGFP